MRTEGRSSGQRERDGDEGRVALEAACAGQEDDDLAVVLRVAEAVHALGVHPFPRSDLVVEGKDPVCVSVLGLGGTGQAEDVADRRRREPVRPGGQVPPQDALLTAVRTVEDPAAIRVGWLIQVARNRLLDVLRRQAHYEGKLRLVGSSDDDVDLPAAVVGRLRMTEALETLRVEHRVVLMLHYVDDLTVAGLAEELGRTPKAIEALLTRARRALRAELERTDA